jgi:hypothetical protein
MILPRHVLPLHGGEVRRVSTDSLKSFYLLVYLEAKAPSRTEFFGLMQEQVDATKRQKPISLPEQNVTSQSSECVGLCMLSGHILK